jgi:hypothetical protein
LLWQYQHEWVTFEVLRHAQQTGKNVVLSPLAYIVRQLLLVLPLTVAPVWIAGLWFFFFNKEGSRYRLLGVAYVVVLVLMIALRGKDYYLLPAYPMLFAGGAVWWERSLQGRATLRWLQVAFPVLLVCGGVLTLPFVVPILPVETYLRYQQALLGGTPDGQVCSRGWNDRREGCAAVYREGETFALHPTDGSGKMVFRRTPGNPGGY